MAQREINVQEMYRVSVVENGQMIQLGFKSDSDDLLLNFDAVKFEQMAARMGQAIIDARNHRRTKPFHS